jgi:hypothetical protein
MGLIDYFVSIRSIQLRQGTLQTVPQLALDSNIIHAMVLCCLVTIAGIMSPHQIDQELDLLRV